MYGNGATWTESTIARLRELWSEGISTNEISRRLGISKNAVVGKAHRLELPGRGSPIKVGGLSRRKTLPVRARSSRTTLPALQSLQQSFTTTSPRNHDDLASRRTPRVATPSAAAPTIFRPWQKSQPCCWPIGEPRSAGFRYCDADSLPGTPYCEEHYYRAHTAARHCAD